MCEKLVHCSDNKKMTSSLLLIWHITNNNFKFRIRETVETEVNILF